MPISPERNVYGALRDGDGTWKIPSTFYGCKPDGTWQLATAVYVYCGPLGAEAWQPLWSAVVPPATGVVATYTAATTSVTISWLPPAVNFAITWEVRRSDGVLIDVVEYDVLSVVDPNPAQGSVTYSVVGVNGPDRSAAAVSAPLVLDFAPTTVTATISNVGPTSAVVNVAWTDGPAGRPDTWRLYNATDNVWVTGDLPVTQHAIGVGGLTLGKSYTFGVYAFIGGSQRGGRHAAATNLPPAPPTNVSIFSSGLSQLCAQFGVPAAGTWLDYHIQRWVDGVWIEWGYVNNGGPFCWGTTTAGYFRVATRAVSGVESAWQQVGPASPVNDVTGPGPSTIASWMPEASYGRLVVRGNWSSDADTATGAIYVSVNSGAWQLVHGPVGISPGAPFVILGAYGNAGETIAVIVRTWDANGNLNTADAVRYYGLAAGTVIINPTDGWTARNGAWRVDGIANQYSLLQGLTSEGENIGFLFYGAALTNYLAGRTFTGGWMNTWRQNSQGSGAAIQPGLVAHPDPSRPAGIPTISDGGLQALGSGLTRPSTGTISITNQIAGLLAGGWYGLAVYRCCATSADPNNPNSFYMKFGDTGAQMDGIIMGQVVLTSLG